MTIPLLRPARLKEETGWGLGDEGTVWKQRAGNFWDAALMVAGRLSLGH